MRIYLYLLSTLTLSSIFTITTHAQELPSQSSEPATTQSSSGQLPTKPEPTTNQVVTDGEIVFTAPPSGNYMRDIRLQNNQGGLRFDSTNVLTDVASGAAIQFFGIRNTDFPGQL